MFEVWIIFGIVAVWTVIAGGAAMETEVCATPDPTPGDTWVWELEPAVAEEGTVETLGVTAPDTVSITRIKMHAFGP
mgnify:FL=1